MSEDTPKLSVGHGLDDAPHFLQLLPPGTLYLPGSGELLLPHAGAAHVVVADVTLDELPVPAYCSRRSDLPGPSRGVSPGECTGPHHSIRSKSNRFHSVAIMPFSRRVLSHQYEPFSLSFLTACASW